MVGSSWRASHPEGSTEDVRAAWIAQDANTRDLGSRSNGPRLPKMATAARVKKFGGSMSLLPARGCE